MSSKVNFTHFKLMKKIALTSKDVSSERQEPEDERFFTN